MPLTQSDLQTARELKERLARLAPLLDFRVFGSRARGDAGSDSDMDVFVEFEVVDKALEARISEVAWEIGFQREVVIAPLVFSRYEVEKSPLRASPVLKAIAEEGLRI
ncbi:nucleotidyltransferase domain-containing protein [Desulfuromonas acetexigens]|jgi:predicted nucleotidyltransferase|uniref:Nucleotidyltransferase domain-containing protein n=1 Tax=Trichloromonas acetexigens TaxID=38815 RepID=A0A550JIM6_9BACT|nr:nucleotidyltransferase domain-containing protein [Desulfuromonas acetexigens]TRO83043.1 nucleotidyltransferase domain-containing protein [Desulfuromonas acetexigens]